MFVSIRACLLIFFVSANFLIWQEPIYGQNTRGAVRHSLNQLLNRMPFTANKKDNNIERLAKEIGWLESYIDQYGSIVAKSPDVWGEARLTKHRFEYEKLLANELGKFQERINGAVSQQDLSFLATAISLSAALDEGSSAAAPVAIADLQNQVAKDTATIKPVDLKRFDDKTISLEQTTLLDQLSRYLGHLHQLRRINEGDDTASSPGYSLNLVRVPVSLLPGNATQNGYGGEITITAQPELPNDLLPTTFRQLVTNDLSRLIGVPITRILNDPKKKKENLELLTLLNLSQSDSLKLVRKINEKNVKVGSGSEYSNVLHQHLGYLHNRFTEMRMYKYASEQKDNKLLTDETRKTLKHLDENRLFRLQLKVNPNDIGLAYNYWRNLPSELLEQERARDKSEEAEKKAEQQQITQDVVKKFASEIEKLDRFEFQDEATITIDKVAIFKAIQGSLENNVGYVETFQDPNSSRSGSLEADLKKALQQLPGNRNDKKSNDAEEIPKGRFDFVLELNAIKKSTKAESAIVCQLVTLRIHCSGNITIDYVGVQNDELDWPELPFNITNVKIDGIEGTDPDCPDRRIVIDLEEHFGGKIEAVFKQLAEVKILASLGGFKNGTLTKFTEIVASVTAGIAKNVIEDLLKRYTGQISLTLQDNFADLQIYDKVNSLFMAIPNGARFSQNPIGPTQIPEIMGWEFSETVLEKLDDLFSRYPGRDFPKSGDAIIHYGDVVRVLHAEVNMAHEFLSQPENAHLWDFVCDRLANAIRKRDVLEIEELRRLFRIRIQSTGMRKSLTEVLAWWILVDSSLLNDRLQKDIKSVFGEHGLEFVCGENCFAGPSPDDCAKNCFNEYVRLRWPIRVFALDPVTSEQNIADSALRRREMQLALSVGLVSGKFNINNFNKFSRLLDTTVETIGLNRTSVGFAHGNDTFGWRFAPRLQTPPAPTGLKAFAENIVGVTAKNDRRCLAIEPGARECIAVVLMPSFIRNVRFDTRSNWYGLANARNTDLTMPKTVHLSRSITSMKSLAEQCFDCEHLYRDQEVSRLTSRVNQLEKELPLQTLRVPIPYENTLGGFQLFNNGITDLAPEIHGWYGAPGVYVDAADPPTQTIPVAKKDDTTENTEIEGTTLFLIGHNLSVHDTQVIAGGIQINNIELISREIMKVTVPKDCQIVQANEKAFVDIHVATPYGVTSHLLVPVVAKQETAKAEKTETEKLEVRVATIESSGLSLGTEEVNGTFKIDETTSSINDVQVDPASKDVVVTNAQTGTKADQLLSAPQTARIAIQVELASPTELKEFVVLGSVKQPKVFTVSKTKHEFKIGAAEVVKAIGQQLRSKLEKITETKFGELKTLEFNCKVFVLLDENGQASQLKKALKVKLNRLKATKISNSNKIAPLTMTATTLLQPTTNAENQIELVQAHAANKIDFRPLPKAGGANSDGAKAVFLNR